MLSADRLVGLMAEPDRRRVIAALILSAGDLDSIMSTAGLERRQAVAASDRLLAAGLIEIGSDGTYVLLEEAFKAAVKAGRLTDGETMDESAGQTSGQQQTPADQVLARSIVDGRLVHLPRKRSRRLIVLDHLSQAFEPGVRYVEREVNAKLRSFDDDVAALRRYLVDEGFLDRGDGLYWRSGGSVIWPGAGAAVSRR